MRGRLFRRIGGCALALAAILVCLLPPARNARAETALATGYVSSSTLNMRPDPSTRGAVVATLSRGDVVNVYEVLGTWLRIDVPSISKSGYVSGKYITLHATSGIYGFGVTNTTVNVRSKNTAESESKGVLPSRVGLTLVKMEANGWWKVQAPSEGLDGYIAKKCVDVICKSAKSGESGTESKATISGEGVNLRKGPSTKDASLGLLKKGTAVTVLGTSGSWCKVKVTSSGKTGYVYKTYVKTSSAPTPKPTSVSGRTATINASGVNLRTSASTSSKSLGLLTKRTPVTVLSVSGDWYKVQVNTLDKTGYVYKTFVTLSNATPAPSATPKPAA